MSDSPVENIPTVPKQLQHSFHSLNILNVRVDVLTHQEITELFLHFLQTKQRGWFMYINIHTIDVAQQLPWFKEFNDQSLVSYCDGEGVRFGARLLGKLISERITLSDYIYTLAEIAVKHNLKLFFLGGTSSVVKRAAEKIKELYPALQIAGYHHGYFSESENKTVIQTINSCQPDILLLGMGAPLQESWTKDNFQKLHVNLIWMGGGFLDTVSGDKRSCPRWLGALGFEWAFRFIQEPRRLWKRYLIGNPIFIFRILCARYYK